MAMFITVTGKHKTEEITWNVGQRYPVLDNSQVTQVQADGHELERILHSFSGLPICAEVKVCNWWGDHAKFICSNLPLRKGEKYWDASSGVDLDDLLQKMYGKAINTHE